MPLEEDRAGTEALTVGRVAFGPPLSEAAKRGIGPQSAWPFQTSEERDRLAHAVRVAAEPEKPGPRLIVAEDEPEDLMRSALQHIAKTAAASRTQSRRCRWIRQRAEAALEGKPYHAGDYESPKYAENSAEKLQFKNRHLRADIARVKAAAEELIRQIAIGTFVDEHGHKAQMLKAVDDLTRELQTAGQGLSADPPGLELLQWIPADDRPDAGVSYLLEVQLDDGSTECFGGWWDDGFNAWLADESGGEIAGKVLRYSDPKGLGA